MQPENVKPLANSKAEILLLLCKDINDKELNLILTLLLLFVIAFI